MNDILQENKNTELIPNRTYLEMVFSAPTVSKRGKNEKEIFENCGNGQFSHTVGTIGVKLGYNKGIPSLKKKKKKRKL